MAKRETQLAIAFSPTFRTQAGWGEELPSSDLTSSFPAVSHNWVETEETSEDVYDCTGEDFLIEKVTHRFSRLTIEFQVTPQLATGWFAMGYGVAGAPSGGTNALQRLISAATSGTWQARFTRNYDMQRSAAINFDANAAAVQAALRAMSNIGSPNLLATGGPLGTANMDLEFVSALASRPIEDLEVLSALAGGALTVQTITPGVGRVHAISRVGVGLYEVPWTTLYIGYRGGDEDPLILRNVVVDSIRCRASHDDASIVTMTVVLIFPTPDVNNPDDRAAGYVMPACMDIEPLRFEDCDLILEGESLFEADGLRWGDGSGLALWRDFEYGFDNGIITGLSANTGKGIDVTRLLRANRRPSYINFGALGDHDSPLYLAAARANPRRYVTSLDLQLGPTEENVLVRAPQGILKLDNPPIRFEGDQTESHVRAIMRPKKTSGQSSTPTNIVATVGQSVAYLLHA